MITLGNKIQDLQLRLHAAELEEIAAEMALAEAEPTEPAPEASLEEWQAYELAIDAMDDAPEVARCAAAARALATCQIEAFDVTMEYLRYMGQINAAEQLIATRRRCQDRVIALFRRVNAASIS